MEKRMEESGRSVADMKRRLEEQNGRLLLTRGSLDNGRRQRIHNQSLKLFQDITIHQLEWELERAEWSLRVAESGRCEEEALLVTLRDTIRTARCEVSAINGEKTQLNGHWQSGLNALHKCHLALATVAHSIRDEERRREEMEQLTSKASKELTLLLEDRSSIQLKMGRLERNISNQETRQQNIHGRNDILQQKLDDIHRDMVAGDDIYHRLLREVKDLEKTNEIWQQRMDKQRRGNQTTQDDIVEQMLQNAAFDQQGKSLCRKIQQSETLSNQLQLQIAKAENRNARLSMAKEQAVGDVHDLSKTLEQQRRDAEHLQRRLDQLQQQCRSNDKILTRREHHLLRTRNSIQQLEITLKEDPCRSEEERQLKAVKEQLEESGRNAEAVQREWYHAEQHLINVANARDQQSAHLENLRDEVNLWQEKKRTLLQQVQSFQESRSKAQRLLDTGRDSLQQLNERLVHQSTTKDNLQRWTHLSHRQWILQLEEPERCVHRLSQDIEELQLRKTSLEIHLCDLSKTAALWMCKLQDIREAQDYIQAERSDAGTLALLHAELHRLQVEDNQLRREQESINHQLLKTVSDRFTLNAKADVKGIGHTTRVLRRAVETNAWHKILAKEMAQRRKEMGVVREVAAGSQTSCVELEKQRDSLRHSLEEKRHHLGFLNERLQEMSRSKRRAVVELSREQKRLRFYESLKNGSYRRRYSSDEALKKAESRISQKIEAMLKTVAVVAERWPCFAGQLQDIQKPYWILDRNQ